jgi:hypothetical protein
MGSFYGQQELHYQESLHHPAAQVNWLRYLEEKKQSTESRWVLKSLKMMQDN